VVRRLVGRICGGTFHAIAHKIIRQHAESFSLPPQFTILDQGDATDLLDVLRPDHGLDGTGQRAPRAAACADIYTRCVNTGRPVSEVVTAGFPWCKPFTAQLAALFRAYTARKRARNLLDFDDLLLLWQRRWPTRRQDQCCVACSTRYWWTSTRTSTLSRPASCGCCSRMGSS
jgi:DNA helicase-2/ATP-dependent DNA helicase PcrA